jgi:hypothetical protein
VIEDAPHLAIAFASRDKRDSGTSRVTTLALIFPGKDYVCWLQIPVNQAARVSRFQSCGESNRLLKKRRKLQRAT